MKMTMRLTVTDLIRALTLRAHALADEIENDGKTATRTTDMPLPESTAPKGHGP